MITVKEQEKLLDLIEDYAHDIWDYEQTKKPDYEKSKEELTEYIRSLTFTAQIGE